MSAIAWRIPSWPGIATPSPRPTWITSMSPGKDRAAPPAARAAAAAAIDGSWVPRIASLGSNCRGRGIARWCAPPARTCCPTTARTSFTASTAAAGWTSPASRCWCARNSPKTSRSKASYFVDKVSGASIDVLSQASMIKDERKQKSAHGRICARQDARITASYMDSVERDYISNTVALFAEPGHVRRPDDLTLGFAYTPRQSRRKQRHRLRPGHRLAGACGKPQLRCRIVADPHQEL